MAKDGKLDSLEFELHYRFYNGSGTWKGSQNIILTFNSKSGAAEKISIPLDRSKCVYGGAEMRSAKGALDLSLGVVVGVTMEVTRVTGIQTPC